MLVSVLIGAGAKRIGEGCMPPGAVELCHAVEFRLRHGYVLPVKGLVELLRSVEALDGDGLAVW